MLPLEPIEEEEEAENDVDEEDDIAEERRLCYVGITRAQEQLTMSLSLTRRKWGKPRPTTPSRFLYEITGKADNPNQYRKRTGRRPTVSR